MSTSTDSPVSSVLRHVTPGLARDYPASTWASPRRLLSLSRNQADATGPVRAMEVAASKPWKSYVSTPLMCLTTFEGRADQARSTHFARHSGAGNGFAQ
jgi:hypothetical protein